MESTALYNGLLQPKSRAHAKRLGMLQEGAEEDERIMAAIKDGERFAVTAHKAEENRASCKDMFDRETLAAVQSQEGDIIRQFELGGCCICPHVTNSHGPRPL